MNDADWAVADVRPAGMGHAFTLRHRDGREVRTTTALPGDFNVANAALALAMVLEAGASPGELTQALGAAGGLSPVVPGRMELVQAGGPRVIVDFAHNPDALELALHTLRPTTAGRLIVVFGATGDRDKGKRPTMGMVAARDADVVVITDDDPHGEDPAAIRAEVLAGAVGAREADPPNGHARPAPQARGDLGQAGDAGEAGQATAGSTLLEIAPRAAAIRRAIGLAGPDDTALIAGRGHERWQEVAGVEYALDDRAEARQALAERENRLRAAVPGSAAATSQDSLANAARSPGAAPVPADGGPEAALPTTKEFPP
jgi:UDP-N-acetylmuramoyl-L-alanyl-D-glutamate--2,6-diaminopimelate ligase